MKSIVSALIAGIVFGLGLTISEMSNPAKVLGFLDILGDWDPSLALVMASGLFVTFIGYKLTWRLKKPLFDQSFQVPGNRAIDKNLALGALLFGIGWGLVGLCPGPAITALSIGGEDTLIFFGAMVAGMFAFDVPFKKA